MASDFPSPSVPSSVACPALFLAAPASGQGKTTITAALARCLRRSGKNVHVFKTGPDYLDPQILAQASGNPVKPLDLWMAGDAWCQQQLYLAAQDADIILIEGAMGMFDGEPSSADLAARFAIPMAIVMDVKGMAQTAAAVVTGLAAFRDDITIAGLLANNCGSERHRELIEAALPENIPLLANLARSEAVALPERHLGLVQAEEVTEELEQRFEAGADWLENAGADQLLEHLSPVRFFPSAPSATEMPSSISQQVLQGRTIAVAKDAAFSFIYPSNIALLESMGATIVFFSPISDYTVPDADALWLPGGYPELHAQALSDNVSLQQSIRDFHLANKPILAECGGFLYCLETLTDLDNVTHKMTRLLNGHGAMRGKRGCQGMQTAPLPEGEIRGHAHHRSRSHDTPEPIAYGRRQRHPAPGEAIYRQGQLTATYLHLFFTSNPDAVAQLFLGAQSGERPADASAHSLSSQVLPHV